MSWTKKAYKNGEAIVEGWFKNIEEGIEEAKAGGGGGGPTVEQSAEVFVTTGGNDTNSGKSFADAKKTIQGAIEALPEEKNKNKIGVVRLGPGEIEAKSTLVRTETVRFSTPASRFVKNSNAVLSDAGLILVNPTNKKPEFIEILETWKGKVTGTGESAVKVVEPEGGEWFWTINGEHGGAGEPEFTMWIVKPAFKLPNAVIIRGQGPAAGPEGHHSEATSVINDNGTGITCFIHFALGQSANTAAMGAHFEQCHFEGNETAIDAVVGDQTFFVKFTHVSVSKYRRWGINLGNNTTAQAEFQSVFVTECGTESAEVGGQKEVPGGGISASEGAPVGTAMNCLVVQNYGTGWEAGGTHFLGCEFNHTKKQEPPGSGKPLTNSGIGLLAKSASVPTQVFGGWSEGAFQANIKAYNSVIIGMHLQGEGGGIKAPVGIEVVGSCEVIGCSFQNYKERTTPKELPSLMLEVNTSSIIKWSSCIVPTKAESIPFIRKANGDIINASAAEGEGRVGGTLSEPTLVTIPMVPKLTKINANTAYRNTLETDVRVTIPIEYETGGLIKVARGPEVGGFASFAPKGLSGTTIEGASLINLNGAEAGGIKNDAIVLFKKLTPGVTGIVEGVPYWVVGGKENGFEVSATKGGTAIKLSPGSKSITEKSTEVVLLQTFTVTGSGVQPIIDLYLPTRCYLSLMPYKASIIGEAIAQPA